MGVPSMKVSDDIITLALAVMFFVFGVITAIIG